MYKVLIVDDERLIRITLKNMLDWKALDCDIIAMVKDGEEALRVVEEVQPEIVITDLKMPGMNGIELIAKIKELNKNTQVIALSNYSDFEYVRDAMKAGAFDYLLKVTLEKSELERIIEQVKQNCVVSSSTDHEHHDSAVRELQQYLVLLHNDHIVNQEELNQVLAQPAFDEYREVFQMAYVRVDNTNFLYQNKIKDHGTLKRHLEDLIKDAIPLTMKYTGVFISNHSGVILFQSSEKLRVLNICNSIIRNISQYMDLRVSITLSDVVHGMDSFYQVFEMLQAAHQNRFYEGEGVLVQSEEQVEFYDMNMNDITLHLDVLEAVRNKNFSRVHQLKEDILLYMKEHVIKPNHVLEYFIFIFHNIEGQEIAKGTRHAIPFDQIAAKIRMCETCDRLTTVLDESFKIIETWLLDDSTNKYRKDVLDIIDYVEKHLDQKLTLKGIADHFQMNESTLSRMFKHDTGVNLNYFINEKKMKKAKELLSGENTMIKDVAMAVGMEDQLYFNKVFKKYYDMSPSEFKKNITDKE